MLKYVCVMDFSITVASTCTRSRLSKGLPTRVKFSFPNKRHFSSLILSPMSAEIATLLEIISPTCIRYCSSCRCITANVCPTLPDDIMLFTLLNMKFGICSVDVWLLHEDIFSGVSIKLLAYPRPLGTSNRLGKDLNKEHMFRMNENKKSTIRKFCSMQKVDCSKRTYWIFFEMR